MAEGRSTMIERSPGVWKLRVHAGRDTRSDPIQVSWAFRGTKWAARTAPAWICPMPRRHVRRTGEAPQTHSSDTYTVTIWKPDFTGGHAVTPYQVDYKGNANAAHPARRGTDLGPAEFCHVLFSHDSFSPSVGAGGGDDIA
jgi:hypothetical protein